MRRTQLMGLALAGVLALGAGAPAVALATQGFTGGGMAATVQANEDWQQSGTCLWRITDGLLEVKPANGANGILDGFGWKGRAAEITSVRVLPGVTAVASCYGMFEGCSSLKTANLTGLGTSSVRTMGSMFKDCSSLVSVVFGGIDTSSVQSMSSMFNGCEALTSLDLSGFDTTEVSSMDRMFYYCEALESLDLSGFKTGLVETMNGMFGHCKSLSSLNITGLDLRDATDLEFMFIGCTSLKSIDLSGVRGSGTTNYKNMFFGSSVEQVTADADTSGPDFPQLAYDTVGWIDTEGNTYDAGAYIPSRTATYRLMLNLSNDMFESIDLSSTDYTGEPITKEVKAGPSIGADEYEVSYENNLNAGTATIRVTGKGRLVGTLEYQFKINKVSIDDAKARLGFSHVQYDGTSHNVIPSVTVNGRELDYGADFTTDYWNTTDAGTATVVITGTGNYYGTTRVTFQIDPTPLDQSATVTIADQPYTGTGITPGFEVRDWNGNVLTAGVDYQYSFSDNINPGTATLTLTGLRNYSGTLVAHFQIIRQEAAGSWQTTSGRWWWRNADGSYPRSCWKQIGGAWYLFDSSGYMLTGWQKVNGIWYYLHGSGAMATGWTRIGGGWYWFDGSGAMQTGWLQLDGTWYWLSSSGAMVTGWQQVGGTWYYFYGSGAMAQSCWVGDYYLTSSGAMATNQRIDGWWVGADGKWVAGA